MTTADLIRSILPDEKAIAAATESSRQIAAFVSMKLDTQHIEPIDEAQRRQSVELPTIALKLLGDILNELALGNGVRVVPVHAELTTQEGADMLNVSRPHLVKLLDEGQIRHTKTGSHRRIKFTDMMAYKADRDRMSRVAMDELAKQGQELDMGYQ
jgi:excisionase family DNA binding protein